MRVAITEKFLRRALAIALVLLPLSPTYSADPAPRCSTLFVSAPTTQKLPDTKIYARGSSKEVQEEHFQFAYESEYLLNVEESAPLLRDYKPNEISLKEWQEYTDEQRVTWLKVRFPHKPELPSETGLKRINFELPFMPDELIVDSTGNVEIVLMPFDTYAQWSMAIDQIVQRYGRGSQQAMVSKHATAARSRKINPAENIKQHLGWLIFTNQFDMFQKLKTGWERYQKDPTKLSVQSFEHPFVGPMNRIKRSAMEIYLDSYFNGHDLTSEQKTFVRRNDASFKYTSGPSYRPDIGGPTRFSWELRNSHKDVVDLKEKMLRDVAAHLRGLDPYSRFAQMEAFDSVAVFNKLAPELQTFLAEVFKSKADPRIKYDSNELIVLQTYRNFAMPLSEFAGFAEALGRTPQEIDVLKKSIREAGVEYLKSLEKIAATFRAGILSREQAKADVMGAIARFGVDSGLVAAFEANAQRIGDSSLSFVEILEISKRNERR